MLNSVREIITSLFQRSEYIIESLDCRLSEEARTEFRKDEEIDKKYDASGYQDWVENLSYAGPCDLLRR